MQIQKLDACDKLLPGSEPLHQCLDRITPALEWLIYFLSEHNTSKKEGHLYFIFIRNPVDISYLKIYSFIVSIIFSLRAIYKSSYLYQDFLNECSLTFAKSPFNLLLYIMDHTKMFEDT